MSKAVMQQALEALERTDAEPGTLAWERENEAMEALRAALAEQAQPVAELVARELERLAQDPPISGNTLAQARALMAAASLRQFGLGGGASAPVAPSGWRMVPVEPTDAMVYAGKEQANKNAGGCRLARKAYSAMLAAAPEAPTPPAPQPLSGLDVERLLEDVVGSLPVARKLIRAVEAEVLRRMGVQQ